MPRLFKRSRKMPLLHFKRRVKVNIHINKHTRFQTWEGRTIFNEYPVHIRTGNFTVTLLFHDRDSMDQLRQILAETICEIDPGDLFENYINTTFNAASNKTRI